MKAEIWTKSSNRGVECLQPRSKKTETETFRRKSCQLRLRRFTWTTTRIATNNFLAYYLSRRKSITETISERISRSHWSSTTCLRSMGSSRILASAGETEIPSKTKTSWIPSKTYSSETKEEDHPTLIGCILAKPELPKVSILTLVTLKSKTEKLVLTSAVIMDYLLNRK